MKRILVITILVFSSFLLGLDLDQSIKIALNNNLDLKAQNASLQAAKADNFDSYLSLGPSATLGMNYRENDVDFNKENYSNTFSLNINQPIFNGGKIILGALINSDIKNIENLSYQAKILEIISDTESKYFSVLETLDRQQIAAKNLQVAQANYQSALVRFETGTISKAELLQLQSDLASKEVSSIQADNFLMTNKQDFKNFLQVDKLDELEKIDIIQYENLISELKKMDIAQIETILKELSDIALNNNPTIKTTMISRETSKKSLWIATGNFMPSVNFSYAKNWGDSDIPGMSQDYDSSQSIGLNISMPIFPLADNGLQVAKANYNLRKATYNAENVENAILLGLRNLLYTLVTNGRLIDSANLAYQYAEATFSQMQERYKSGLITTNDLLSASIMLSSSKSQYTTAKYNFLKSQTALLNLLGINDRNKINDIITIGDKK